MRRSRVMVKCRSASSAKYCAVLLALAMAVSSTGPGMRTVKAQTAPVGAGFELDAGDLRFIYRQIQIAQAHSAGGELFGSGPNQVNEQRLPFGLRTIDGSDNHLTPGTRKFGAADQLFPRLSPARFDDAEALTIDPDGEGGQNVGDPTSYKQAQGFVSDSDPRVISNLIVDQTANNFAAEAVAALNPDGPQVTPSGSFFIPNVAPDVGLSAPFSSMFTFFGQFFDHGLDLLNKGGSGTVIVPLQADDPLVLGPDGEPDTADDLPADRRFMLLTRGTHTTLPGPDGTLGTADDIHEGRNQTSPFVDQNQTYTSHPSHQVFLREYAMQGGRPVSTGKMIDGVGGNIGNWAEVKAQAAAMLGIILTDQDVFNLPLLLTDSYGYFKRGANGLPQFVMPDGSLVPAGDDPATPAVETARLIPEGAQRTNHAFLDDIAHSAVPGPGLVADDDLVVNAPGAQPAGTYDNELLDAHFVTGDGRGNENIALTAVHTVFHSEHNRLANYIPGKLAEFLAAGSITQAEFDAWHAVDPASGWDFGERLFQAAKFVTEMQYQHLVFEEFARKLVPSINEFIGDGINFIPSQNPAISAEFAHAAYRLGHSMLTETISRTAPDGTVYDISLVEGFLNPLEFNRGPLGETLTAAQAAGAIWEGGTRQVGNDIDEFVTDAVRNNLLGLPLDLATINITRGRSEGLPPLNSVRRAIFDATSDSQLTPYGSWKDFEFSMKHSESLVNFVAAYGTHPTITGAQTVADKRAAAAAIVLGVGDVPADAMDFLFSTGAWANDANGFGTTGYESIDLWIGGLAERLPPFGGMLGTTFNYIFEVQLEALQNADRFYYLERLDGLNLLAQLEANSFAELIKRNTEAEDFGADPFGRPDFVINLGELIVDPANPSKFLNDPTDDPATPENDGALVRLPNGTVRYIGDAHVIWNGTAGPDRVISSEGDDSLLGNGGNDVMEGGQGNDQHVGGAGDDILTDTFGEDVMKGGPGNDAISGGSGPFDLLQGNDGHDFVVGGNDVSEVFGGAGNDIIYAGKGATESFGGAGDDWMEGTDSPASVLVGDENNQFQNDPNGGHDVFLAGPGDADFDMEGGDDIMVGNVLPTHRFEGMLGFDWVTYRGETLPVDADMLITGAIAVNAPLNENRDRFDLTEALSGSSLNDVLRGDDRIEAELRDDGLTGVANAHVLTAAGIARISGLAALLRGATEYAAGNIILGGAGSDVIEGRAGNDVLDGDRWLNVQLAATYGDGSVRRFDSLQQVRADVFAGLVNPGAIAIERSIVPSAGVAADCSAGAAALNCDTAVFTGNRAEYTIQTNADGSLTVTDTVAVRPGAVGTGNDGVDTLWNFERLQFADGTIAAPGAEVGTLVPNVVGRTQAEAQALITGAGLTIGSIVRANNPAVACNIVLDQSPLAGIGVADGSAVSFTVSLGPAVPDVHDMTVADARADIEAAGLTLGTITEVFSERAVGVVATGGQDPLPGTPCVAPGSAVNLFISKGPAPDGLVLSLNFDAFSGGRALDISGSNNHGTITGATLAPGRFGANALRFDGNDLVTVLDNAEGTLDLEAGMTLEAWVQPTGAQAGWDTVMLKENGNALSYALYARDGAPSPGGTAFPAGYINNGGVDVAARGIAALPVNTWTHLATTYDGTNLRLYVNGVLRRTVASAGAITIGDGPLNIGGNNAFPGEFFVGLIDEVKVYNRALSAAEITSDMNNTPPAPPAPAGGLVLSLTFDTATVAGTTANDASGLGNHGTIEGAVPVAAGKGGALRFDGVDDSVAVADHPSLGLTTAMTVEAWVNPSTLDGWETIVLKEGAEARGCCSNVLSYALYGHDGAAGPNGYIRTGGADQGIHTTPAIPVNTWTHLAVTYDGANLRFYRNGTLVSTRAQTGAIDPGVAGLLRIGGNNAFAGEFFSGVIDEVKVYNRALSAAEIVADRGATPPPIVP